MAVLHHPEPAGWPADATHDQLVGTWRLWQRKGGHRTSTDDLLTAWLAVHLARDHGADPPLRYADIGCGIGSVMLMTAHALRPDLTRGFEAQPQSVTMARRSVAELPDRLDIEVVESDLRELDAEAFGPFDLITGSPPYLPVGTGVMSPDPQRRACRFELRGGVEDYCATAARLLTSDGRFVLVFQTEWDARVLAAAASAGLRLEVRADVRTRAGDDRPFLSVYAFRAAASGVDGGARVIEFATRGADGAITPEYLAARQELGFSR